MRPLALLAVSLLVACGDKEEPAAQGAGGTQASGGAAGSAGATGSAGKGGDPFADLAVLGCDDPLEGMAAELGADGIELLRLGPDKTWSTIKTDGVLCAGAKDAAACQSKIDAARAAPPASTLKAKSSPWNDRPRDVFLLTRGDDVLIANDPDTLSALLYPVTNAARLALWMPYARPIANPCTLRWGQGEGFLNVWVINEIMDVCPVLFQDEHYWVAKDGTTTYVDSGDWRGNGTCGKLP